MAEATQEMTSMTSEVTQAALEPCPNPWCNSRKTVDCEIRAAEAPILMPSRSSAEWAVACPVCPLQTPYFDTEAEAIAAWNTRLTAQSGEGRALPWLSKLLRYHETGGHEGDGSDHAMRNARTELDAIVSGEGRSGAGEEALRDALNAFTDAVGKKCREAGLSYELPRAEALKAGMVAALAALNARQSGEGEREATLEAALWSVLSYVQLLRQYEGPQAILFAGDVEKIDATYDAMIAKVTAALRATDDAGGA